MPTAKGKAPGSDRKTPERSQDAVPTKEKLAEVEQHEPDEPKPDPEQKGIEPEVTQAGPETEVPTSESAVKAAGHEASQITPPRTEAEHDAMGPDTTKSPPRTQAQHDAMSADTTKTVPRSEAEHAALVEDAKDKRVRAGGYVLGPTGVWEGEH